MAKFDGDSRKEYQASGGLKIIRQCLSREVGELLMYYFCLVLTNLGDGAVVRRRSS